MAQYGRGAKAGLVAGLIQGIIVGILSYFIALQFKSVIVAAMTKSLQNSGTTVPINVNSLADAAIAIIPVFVIIGGLIGGLILGLIFAAVEGRYFKSQSIIVRGLVFGMILFLIDLVLNIGSFAYGSGYAGLSLVGSLLGSLLFGYLLGFFFQRFGPPVMPATTFSSQGSSYPSPPTLQTPTPSGSAQSWNQAGSTCPKCGAPIGSDSVFCPSCGANLKQ